VGPSSPEFSPAAAASVLQDCSFWEDERMLRSGVVCVINPAASAPITLVRVSLHDLADILYKIVEQIRNPKLQNSGSTCNLKMQSCSFTIKTLSVRIDLLQVK
jgi:hypothetical protein